MFRVGEGDLERAAAAVPGAGDLGSKIQSSRELCIKEGKSLTVDVYFFFFSGEKKNCTKQFVFNYTVVVGKDSHKIHKKTHLKSLEDIHPIAIALSQKIQTAEMLFSFQKSYRNYVYVCMRMKLPRTPCRSSLTFRCRRLGPTVVPS